MAPTSKAPIGPLTRKRRVVLLLNTYLEAATAETGEVQRSGSKPGSRMPVRGQLWRDGSYAELEAALDKLRARWRHLHTAVWRYYVERNEDVNTTAVVTGLRYIAGWMSETVFVPEEVAVAAGYLPSEASKFARRRAR